MVHGYTYDPTKTSDKPNGAQTFMLDAQNLTKLRTFTYEDPRPDCLSYLSHREHFYWYNRCYGNLSASSTGSGKTVKNIPHVPHAEMREIVPSPQNNFVVLISHRYNECNSKLALVDTDTDEVYTPLNDTDVVFDSQDLPFFISEDCLVWAGRTTKICSGSFDTINFIRYVPFVVEEAQQ